MRVPDEELFVRYRQGEEACFSELVGRYQGELYDYLCRYLGNEALAQDVFQNTFMQLHVKGHMYDTGRRLRPWLYTIATNLAVDAIRKRARQRAVSMDSWRLGGDNGRGLADLLASDGPSPLDSLEKGEQAQRVRDAVGQLPDHQRVVLVLTYYSGMKYREVAEIVDIPVGTVKSRLHAAIQELGRIWRAPEASGCEQGTVPQ